MANNYLGHMIGTTFELIGYITDPENIINGVEQPKDITGWVITCQLFPPRYNNTTRLIITLDVALTDAVGGVYLIDNPDLNTANWLKNTKYNMKLIMTRPDAYIYPTPTIVIDSLEFL